MSNSSVWQAEGVGGLKSYSPKVSGYTLGGRVSVTATSPPAARRLVEHFNQLTED